MKKIAAIIGFLATSTTVHAQNSVQGSDPFAYMNGRISGIASAQSQTSGHASVSLTPQEIIQKAFSKPLVRVEKNQEIKQGPRKCYAENEVASFVFDYCKPNIPAKELTISLKSTLETLDLYIELDASNTLPSDLEPTFSLTAGFGVPQYDFGIIVSPTTCGFGDETEATCYQHAPKRDYLDPNQNNDVRIWIKTAEEFYQSPEMKLWLNEHKKFVKQEQIKR